MDNSWNTDLLTMEEKRMKNVLITSALMFFLYACSSSDDEKNVVQSSEELGNEARSPQLSASTADNEDYSQLNNPTQEVQKNNNQVDNNFDLQQYHDNDVQEPLDVEQSKGKAPVELVSVDTCFAHYEYDNPTVGVESFTAKRNEGGFSVRVLGNTQCPPAEKPDYLEYSYEGDTLVLSIDKKDRSFDVTSSCMYWAEILIKGDVSFSKIQINGNTFSVTVE